MVLQAGQLEVNWVTAGRSSRGSVRSGSSTVLALSGDSRSGTELELSIGRQIVGIAALSVCRWYVAVRCQRQVDCRRNGTIV